MQKWLGQEDFQRKLEELPGAVYVVIEETGREAAVIEETLRQIADGLPPGAEEWYCVPDWEEEGEYRGIRLQRGQGRIWEQEMEDLAVQAGKVFLEQWGETKKETDWPAWQEEAAAQLLEPINERWSAPEMVAYQTGFVEKIFGILIELHELALYQWLPEPMQRAREKPVIRGEGLSRASLAGHPEYRETRRWVPGLLQEASGGYLLLSAEELMSNAGAWRCLRDTMLREKLPGPGDFPFTAQVILYGSASLYRGLKELETDFAALFSQTVLLPSFTEENSENGQAWEEYLRARCEEQGLELDKEAVPVLLEQICREYGIPKQLPCCFLLSEDLLNQGILLCRQEEKDCFDKDTARTVACQRRQGNQNLTWRFFNMNRSHMDQIHLHKEEIGVVNGLAVLDMGYFRMAQPMRMAARYRGSRMPVDSAEVRAGMGGRVFNKGIENLRGYLGYLGCRKGREILLLCEQNYSVIEGDSGSLAQAYGILSLLSGFPLCQRIAVTGSLSSEGRLLPIGGINEKIEGFYDFCQWRQEKEPCGVLFPAANLGDLRLAEDVRKDIDNGNFFLYPAETLEEGIPLLTGAPAGKVLRKACRKL